MAIGGFGGAFGLQQAANIQKAQDIQARIGFVPQGGPRNTHADPTRAVNLGGPATFVVEGPGNMMTFAPGGPKWIEGLGVDLNRDGKFENGKDGHLAIDINQDGVLDRKDVDDTLQMLSLFSGGNSKSKRSTQGVGGFNTTHQAEVLLLQARGKQFDLNQDGVLAGWELAKAGAKVLVDEGQAKLGLDGDLKAHALPGTYTPEYKPNPQYYPRPPFFGGQSPQIPMNFGPPAFFMQVLHTMMSFFARPF